MPVPPSCPDSSYWQSLLAADLPPADQEQIERHLERCPACQACLDQPSEDGDPLLLLVRQVGGPATAPAEPALTRVMEHLHRLQPPAKIDLEDLYFLHPTDRPDLLGTLGDYEVWEVIGTGGMGVVLKAFEPALHRFVAIKVLAAAVAGSATARRRFTREAQAAAAVCHDHVVTVHGVQEADGLPYLVMQYVAGESLQDCLDRKGPLELEEIVRIGMQTASGLAAAHAQGLIHRDIKPANLLLENGLARVKITDFGLARMTDDVGLTQAGVVAGTPEYMAPEQARGEAIDHRADLFSLGSVLYAMCTGRPPFQGASAVGVLRQVSDETPKPICTLNPKISAWLETLIARLLAKTPADRFQSAAEVAGLLEGYRAHLLQPATAPPPVLPPVGGAADRGKQRPLGRKTGYRRMWPALLVSSLLLGGLVLFAFQPTEPAGAPPALPAGYYHDFRGRPLPPELTVVGEDQYIHFEPEGVRITLPRDRQDLWHVGIGTLFDTRGDFEITTTVELLQADAAVAGFGVGVSLYVKKDQPPREAASVCRLVRAKDKQIVLWDRALEEPGPGGEPKFEWGVWPCLEKVVRLRLKRTGTVLHYLWAPGLTEDRFVEIHQCEFGSEDISRVGVRGLTGRKPYLLDFRLVDLRIRSANQVVDKGASPSSRSLWKVWLVVGIVLLLSLGIWLAIGQRRRAGKGPATAPADGQQAKPIQAAGTISFPCSECGKPIKTRAELAGKKVRCPQCKQPVLVPEGETGSRPPVS